jgi:electron transport complex protein RnfC
VADLIAFCGGFATRPARLVNGGPMMGQPLPSLEVPVVKGTSGILALSPAETNEAPEGPCVRCGACVSACPCGLVPVEMAANIRHDRLEAAARLGVGDCIGCGSCAWVCPSHIPLVQYFQYANGALSAQERERRKHAKTASLAEAHMRRLERVAAAKAAAKAAGQAARKTQPAPAPAPTPAQAPRDRADA